MCTSSPRPRRTPRSWPRPTRPTAPAGSTATTRSCCARGPPSSTSIGQIGVDPGTEWGTGLDQHRGQHAASQGRRSRPATPTAPTPSTRRREWDGFATDNIADLGTHLAPALTCSDDARPGRHGDRRAGERHRQQRHGGRHRAQRVDRPRTDPRARSARTGVRALPRPTAATDHGDVHGLADARRWGRTRSPSPRTNDDGAARPPDAWLRIERRGLPRRTVCGDPATAIHAIQGTGAEPRRSADRS